MDQQKMFDVPAYKLPDAMNNWKITQFKARQQYLLGKIEGLEYALNVLVTGNSAVRSNIMQRKRQLRAEEQVISAKIQNILEERAKERTSGSSRSNEKRQDLA